MLFADIFLVGLGGGLGSLCRWLVGKLISEEHPTRWFPLGTFLINVSGAFLIGYLATRFSIGWADRYGSFLTAGVLTGFIGGYTTFSSMQLDAATIAKGSAGRAIAYLVGSVGAGLAAAALGIWLAR